MSHEGKSLRRGFLGLGWSWRKWARVGLATVVFVVFVLTFCGVGGVAGAVGEVLASGQFGVSVLGFVGGAMLFGWAAVLVLTFLLGRVYCSVLCPLGILQDVAWWARGVADRVLGRKLRGKFSKEWKKVRWGILLGTVLAVGAGWGSLVLAVVDPYSVFGRVASNVGRPVLAMLNNGVAWVGETTGWFSVYTRSVVWGSGWVLVVATGIVGVVIVMAAGWGRIWCNTVCPVGTVLGFVAKRGVLRVGIRRELCVKCGECAKVCRAGCIDLRKGEVDASRCVSCFDCEGVCEDKGIGLMRGGERADVRGQKPDVRSQMSEVRGQKSGGGEGEVVEVPVDERNLGRRRFLGGVALLAGAAGVGVAGRAAVGGRGADVDIVGGRRQGKGEGGGGAGRGRREWSRAVCPPGAGSVSEFLEKCTGCALCVSECEGKVLQESFFEYGSAKGFLKPRLDFVSGYCLFECTKCGEVCPSGAIKEVSVEEKKRVQIGMAEFHLGLCVVNTDHTACGACAEHCPTQAVRMVDFYPEKKPEEKSEYVEGLFIPEMRKGACIGCGTCEAGCPADPKAISMKKGLAVHRDELCRVVRDHVNCGECAQNCPSGAVTMVPYRPKKTEEEMAAAEFWEGLTLPEVHAAQCIGCGACEYACPVEAKAIRVKGLESHGVAKVVKEEKLKAKTDGFMF